MKRNIKVRKEYEGLGILTVRITKVLQSMIIRMVCFMNIISAPFSNGMYSIDKWCDDYIHETKHTDYHGMQHFGYSHC